MCQFIKEPINITYFSVFFFFKWRILAKKVKLNPLKSRLHKHLYDTSLKSKYFLSPCFGSSVGHPSLILLKNSNESRVL